MILDASCRLLLPICPVPEVAALLEKSLVFSLQLLCSRKLPHDHFWPFEPFLYDFCFFICSESSLVTFCTPNKMFWGFFCYSSICAWVLNTVLYPGQLRTGVLLAWTYVKIKYKQQRLSSDLQSFVGVNSICVEYTVKAERCLSMMLRTLGTQHDLCHTSCIF